ncbi:MAG TPA: peptidylprolyl isomerase [Anaerolineae bacterium]|nr:peptidylprolyl isomerase [Anaerolineae bacterium]HNT04927.1 peptidylprolyl isomerase [Anaerolineae bacterium]
MKTRTIAAAMLLLGLALTSGCAKGATPTATVAPGPTSAPTIDPTLSPTSLPPGGVDVAWQHIVQPTGTTLARVNGEEVDSEEFLAVLKRQLHVVTAQYAVDWNEPSNQSLIPGFEDQILSQMIQDVLLRQLATAEGITVTDEDIETERASIEKEVVSSGQYPTWEAFLLAMGSNPKDFGEQIRTYLYYKKLLSLHGGPTEVEQVNARHILVDSEEKGQEVLKKLKEGATFADLAKEYSTDTGSASSGGDLGWFPRGMMVTEFEEAAFTLPIGETSGLIKTDFGYHIIQVVDRGTRPLPAEMLEQHQQEAFGAWYDAEYENAKIETLVTFETPEPTLTPTS